MLFSAREELRGVVKSGNLDFCYPPRVFPHSTPDNLEAAA